jgi:hypothetical protein
LTKKSKQKNTSPAYGTLSFKRGEKGIEVFDCAHFARKISRSEAENF